MRPKYFESLLSTSFLKYDIVNVTRRITLWGDQEKSD